MTNPTGFGPCANIGNPFGAFQQMINSNRADTPTPSGKSSISSANGPNPFKKTVAVQAKQPTASKGAPSSSLLQTLTKWNKAIKEGDTACASLRIAEAIENQIGDRSERVLSLAKSITEAEIALTNELKTSKVIDGKNLDKLSQALEKLPQNQQTSSLMEELRNLHQSNAKAAESLEEEEEKGSEELSEQMRALDLNKNSPQKQAEDIASKIELLKEWEKEATPADYLRTTLEEIIQQKNTLLQELNKYVANSRQIANGLAQAKQMSA